jgi:hypothetical protein
MGRPALRPSRRVHLFLSQEVWGAVCAEAGRRRVSPSRVVQCILADALTPRAALAPAPPTRSGEDGTPCVLRVRVERDLWAVLQEEAWRYRLSPGQLARDQLWERFMRGGRSRSLSGAVSGLRTVPPVAPVEPAHLEGSVGPLECGDHAGLRMSSPSADTDGGAADARPVTESTGLQPMPIFDLEPL